jgi:hypothetical protein
MTARLNIRCADTTGPVVRDALVGAAFFAGATFLAGFFAGFFFVAFFFADFFGDFLLAFFADFFTDFFTDFFFAAMVLWSSPDDYRCSHP